MAREFLMLTTESAYKTATSPAITWPTGSANTFYVRLDGENQFTMRPRPVMVTVPYGGGSAYDAFRVSDKLECKGQLTTKLYAGPISQLLLQWACRPVQSGGTDPWTTSEPVGDLASMTIYHAVQRSDGTYKKRLYNGAKIDAWTLDITEKNTIATLSLEISASTPQGNQWDSSTDPTSAFPAPTDSPNQYPTTGTTGPYTFVHASGGLLIGTARTQFQSIRLSSHNVLAKRYWCNRFLAMQRLVGRSTTLVASNLYNPTPDDRTSYEGIVGFTTGGGYSGTDVSFTLSNTSHSVVFDLKNNDVITSIEDQLPMNDVYMQDITVTNQYDPTSSTDFTVAFT